MKIMTFTEFKNRFPDIIKGINADEKIAITYGKKKKIVGYFVPEIHTPTTRQLGILEGKAQVIFGPGFEMTTEAFLGLE